MVKNSSSNRGHYGGPANKGKRWWTASGVFWGGRDRDKGGHWRRETNSGWRRGTARGGHSSKGIAVKMSLGTPGEKT